MAIDAAALLIFPALAAAAAATDLLTFRIPNRLTLALVLGFVVMAVAFTLPAETLFLHAGAAFAMLALGFALFLPGWIGGGDAKLLAAIALWLGFEPLPAFLIYSSLAGGALTLLILMVRRMPLPAVLARQDWALRLHDPRAGVPYGVALGVGSLLVWPDSIWFRAFGH